MGVSECRRCHNKVNSTDNYCSNCGLSTKPVAILCSNCGRILKDKDNFCPNCGTTALREDELVDYEIPSEKPKTKKRQEKNLRGIGGWLLLFVISLFLSAFRLFSGIHFFSSEDCATLRYYSSDSSVCPAFEAYYNYFNTVTLIIGGVLLVIIYLILRKRESGKVLAIIALISYAIAAIIGCFWLNAITHSFRLPWELSDKAMSQEFASLFGIIAYVVIWVLYLLNSGRVHMTLRK